MNNPTINSRMIHVGNLVPMLRLQYPGNLTNQARYNLTKLKIMSSLNWRHLKLILVQQTHGKKIELYYLMDFFGTERLKLIIRLLFYGMIN